MSPYIHVRLRIVIQAAYYAIALFCLCACALPTERASTLEQKQRENVAQRATSEFARSVAPDPVTVTVKGKDGSETIVSQPARSKVTGKASAEEESDSHASGNSLDSVTIPLFVKLIGAAIGLALLAGVIFGIVWWLRRSSLAVNALYTKADEAIASKIQTIQALKGATTDPARIQALTEAEAHLQGARAEANK